MTSLPRSLFLAGLLLLIRVPLSFSQTVSEAEKAFEANYAKRILQDRINGIYVPYDLPDAFRRLDVLIEEQDRNKIRELDEQFVVHKTYFSLVRWIVENWGFYEGSRLSHQIRTIYQLTHPEDMGVLVVRAYLRYLKQQKPDYTDILAEIRKNREAEFKKLYRKNYPADSLWVPKDSVIRRQ